MNWLNKLIPWAALAALGLSAPLYAQENIQETDTPVESAETEPARPALWEVADEDTRIYLFGTIHLLPPGINWFEGPVERAFRASDELVTEIVGEDAGTMEDLIAEKAILAEGQTLRTLLDVDRKAALETTLQRMQLPPSTFDRFEPWYAAITLSTLPIIKSGFATVHGVEDALEAKAKARGMPHSALETAEFQLHVFDTLPLEVQKRYLAEVIEKLPDMQSDLQKMLEAWKQGNAETLAELLNENENDPALIEALLISRNRTWSEWIAKRLDSPGTVFLAVGAGHLAGKGSVQDQLDRKGISTRRVQ